MRILFPFVGDHIGGSHIASILLIKDLKETEFNPIVVLHQNGPLAEYLKENNIDYTILNSAPLVKTGPFIIQILQMIKALPSFAKILNEKNIDIVHTNDLRIHYSWILPAFFNKKAKHIWHQHSQSNSWRFGLLSFFTNKVLTISQHCKKGFPFLFRRKSQIVYNPFQINPSPANKNSIHKGLNLSEEVKVIGFIGNLTNQKRPDFFIDLANHIHNHPDKKHTYHFILIGEKRDPLYEDLIQHVKNYHLENYVHFLGPRFPIESYISGLDILIAPAENEGLGRTIIESMLCGTAIIASNDGGHKEIIRNRKTGFLITKDDLEAFTQATFEIINHPEQANEMVESAKKYAISSFSNSIYTQHIKNIYRSVKPK